MAKTKNITKRMVLEAIKAAADGIDFGDVVTAEDVIAYADTAIAQLDAKAAKAQERAAKTKAEGDELRAVVESVLSVELQGVDAITAQVNAIEGYEEITKSKVVARLSQLVKMGVVRKEQIKIDNRKVMGYAIEESGEDVAE